ncbi:MAG: hypothetical protein A2563_00480 [Candidatus Magasanikbacteria bacterium RIFOXYD1_FULL_40_23]|uniref:thioredoxin-dependent peroxiredoxin n=1 Tax=Candidatus Magasanikbacteria bacterium RIFOXYD1_FULL_40_23 TaxID=1798705 RepID=A0A1F6P7Y8_9BACT|nr:MAG: hypothetical protein A2563_00480 [Candidatus Magasanikbacteria bacterium RIFOXYD1_FULL_40_23]
MLEEKILAPDFTLPDQNYVNHKLSDYRGQWVLLYFYPADDTPGCTTEACNFKDNLPTFEDLKVKVFGISTDSVESHQEFVNKYSLNFTLLSDSEKEVVEKYEANGMVGTKRVSYLINPQGEIFKAYDKVKPENHVGEVLADLNSYPQ